MVSGFWRGLGSGVGVSGGWRCLVGGSWFVGGGWCGVWGAVPLRPLLNSPPPSAWCAVVLGSGRPSVGWWFLSAGGCLVGGSSFLGGWAGLVGGLSCWLCSGWVVLDLGSWLRFSLVVQVRPRVCWGVPWWRALWVVSVSGGCSLRVVLFPLGGPTWTVGLFVAPPFPPTIHDEASQTLRFDGQDHTLKR